MDTIVMFDTSQGSDNLGDYIIMESIFSEMKHIFAGKYLLRYPTHLPLRHLYNTRGGQGLVTKNIARADYKFIGGTNIIKKSLRTLNPIWNINTFDVPQYEGCITIGCGLERTFTEVNRYTQSIYQRIFSKQYIHSVRDERTKVFFENLGLRAINTGCAVMWGLTPEHCQAIPRTKADSVVFTLTDYEMNPVLDQVLIDTLKRAYSNVFFWPQGPGDYAYFKSLEHIEGIRTVNPTIEDFAALLDTQIDYIGTRLHGGIYALRHKCRSIILTVDERMRNINENCCLPLLEREDIGQLLQKIHSAFDTDVQINTAGIRQWKEQFGFYDT